MASVHNLFSKQESADARLDGDLGPPFGVEQPPDNHHRRTENELTPIVKLLLALSGARSSLVVRAGGNEVKTYTSIGAANGLTATLAWVSGAYAVFLISKSPLISFYVGFLWSLYVLNVDRSIISTLKLTADNTRGRVRNGVLVGLRLLMALIVSIVVSEPLTLWIFSKEISVQLEATAADEAKRVAISSLPAEQIDMLKAEIGTLRVEIVEQQERRDRANQAFIAEAEGTGGTMMPGKGSVFAEKQEEFSAQEAALRDLKTRNQRLIDDRREKIARLEQDGQLRATMIMRAQDQADGLAAQISALHSMITDRPVLLWVRRCLALLFIIIEITPISVKLMRGAGPYDKLLAYLERRAERKIAFYQKLDEEAFAGAERGADQATANVRMETVEATMADYRENNK